MKVVDAAMESGSGESDGAAQPATTVPMRAAPTLRVSGPDPTPPSDPDAERVDPDPDHADTLVGRIIAGRYEVMAILGRGGMGIVYEARHITVGRRIALKVLRPDLARSTEAVMRFHREAKAAASIGSEHIVEVFDFGYADEGEAYIAMELLEGEDLGRKIRRDGPMPEARAIDIARQIARALAAAHGKGIIHRDLKSENIFVSCRDGADFVKLLDFGISKVSEGEAGRGPMTSEGVVMGTPHYMAPEQAMSALEADHRIDLYALGCLLYEMLTGRVPFTGKNPVEVVFKHVHEPAVPPSAVVPNLSPAVDRVVMKALAKNRDERFATAMEMLTALGNARSSAPSIEPPVVTPVAPPVQHTRRDAVAPRRAWGVAVIATFAVLTGGVVAYGVMRRGSQSPPVLPLHGAPVSTVAPRAEPLAVVRAPIPLVVPATVEVHHVVVAPEVEPHRVLRTHANVVEPGAPSDGGGSAVVPLPDNHLPLGEDLHVSPYGH